MELLVFFFFNPKALTKNCEWIFVINFNIPTCILLASTFICFLTFLLWNIYAYRKIDKTNISSINYHKANIYVASKQVKE